MSVTISGTNGITSNSTVIPNNEVLVTLDDTQTLTNKTLGATAFTGNITSSGNPSLNLGTGALTAGSATFGSTANTTISSNGAFLATGIGGYVAVQGTGNPTAGAGLEFNGGAADSFIQGYNRIGGSYIPVTIKASQFLFKYNGSSTVLDATSTGLVVTGRILSPAIQGNSYTQTSVSSDTSIVDTGIYFNTAILGYGLSSIYEVCVTGCPNANGSVIYRDVIYGNITINGCYINSALSQEIRFTPIVDITPTGVGANLTVTAVFWNGSSEVNNHLAGETSWQIRIKVSGYGNNTGSDQQVRITKKL
jgi:hypothetical protein